MLVGSRRTRSIAVGFVFATVILLFCYWIHPTKLEFISNTFYNKCFCEYKGALYDFCYRMPQTPSVTGKRFSCEYAAILGDFDLLSGDTALDMAVEGLLPPAYVVPMSENHYLEGLTLIANVRSLWPTQKILVYDLGLEKTSAKQLSMLLKEFGALWYMDASVRWKKDRRETVYKEITCRRKTGPSQLEFDQSVINILLGNSYGFDTKKYISSLGREAFDCHQKAIPLSETDFSCIPINQMNIEDLAKDGEKGKPLKKKGYDDVEISDLSGGESEKSKGKSKEKGSKEKVDKGSAEKKEEGADKEKKEKEKSVVKKEEDKSKEKKEKTKSTSPKTKKTEKKEVEGEKPKEVEKAKEKAVKTPQKTGEKVDKEKSGEKTGEKSGDKSAEKSAEAKKPETQPEQKKEPSQEGVMALSKIADRAAFAKPVPARRKKRRCCSIL
ncbi:hypothetical protein RB195_019867 [Necator americanus]|uniref:Uncharacterized protein n=1 Tax=Necator americanus TaxID=51031 RepID=A0ABR1CG49_NECAM